MPRADVEGKEVKLNLSNRNNTPCISNSGALNRAWAGRTPEVGARAG